MAMLPRMDMAGTGEPRADDPRGEASRNHHPAAIDRDPRADRGAIGHDQGADPSLPRGCPFLVALEGGWRLDNPSRDHRCAAFSPPASLSPEKQSRLCLTAAHTGCATFLASVAAREQRLGSAPADRATRWGLARTTTVIEDPGGLRGRVLGAALDRRRWPAIPAVLLVTTLFTLAISGFRAGVPATTVATASPGRPADTFAPTPRGSQSATKTGQPTDSQTPSAPPSSVPSGPPATSSPSSTPSPSFRTYRVVSGDTMSAIAGRFDTTISAIVKLNDIADPSQLHIGQVLLIP
jgi:LysM repeat protein